MILHAFVDIHAFGQSCFMCQFDMLCVGDISLASWSALSCLMIMGWSIGGGVTLNGKGSSTGY